MEGVCHLWATIMILTLSYTVSRLNSSSLTAPSPQPLLGRGSSHGAGFEVPHPTITQKSTYDRTHLVVISPWTSRCRVLCSVLGFGSKRCCYFGSMIHDPSDTITVLYAKLMEAYRPTHRAVVLFLYILNCSFTRK